MPSAENGRSMGEVDDEQEPVSALLNRELPYTQKSYYLDKPKDKIDFSEVPHVEDINAYESRIVEAEIAARFPVPIERRPFSLRSIVTLFPTILG